MSSPAALPWYKRPAVLWASLIFFPPLGIALTWLSDWSPQRKKVTSGVAAAWLLLAMASGGTQTPEIATRAAETPAQSTEELSEGAARRPAPEALEPIELGLLFPKKLKSESGTSQLIQTDSKGMLQLKQDLDSGNVEGVLTVHERSKGETVVYAGQFEDRDATGFCTGPFTLEEIKPYNWQLKRTYKAGSGCSLVGDVISTDFYKVDSSGELLSTPKKAIAEVSSTPKNVTTKVPLAKHSNFEVFIPEGKSQYMTLQQDVGKIGELYMGLVDVQTNEEVDITANCIDVKRKGRQADLSVDNNYGYFEDYSDWLLSAAIQFCNSVEIADTPNSEGLSRSSDSFLEPATLKKNREFRPHEIFQGGVLEDNHRTMVIFYKTTKECGDPDRSAQIQKELEIDWNNNSWQETIVWNRDCSGDIYQNMESMSGSFRNPTNNYLELDSFNSDGTIHLQNNYEIWIGDAPTSFTKAPIEASHSSDSESELFNTNTDSSAQLPSTNSEGFPRSTCGDSGGSGAEWFPVFIANGNLDSIRENYCQDAIPKKDKDTGTPIVQLASFTDVARAEAFAEEVEGEVGTSYTID